MKLTWRRNLMQVEVLEGRILPSVTVLDLTPVVRTAASHTTAAVAVSVDGSADRLDAWVDFNHDSVWDDSPDSPETIADDVAVSLGENLLSFDVPAGALPGTTIMRLRLSSTLGQAAESVVEDHEVVLLDGDVIGGAALRMSLPSSGDEFDITHEETELVVRQRGGVDLLRVPANSVASLNLTGTAGPESIIVDLREDLERLLRLMVAGGGGADAVAVFCSNNVDRSAVRPFAATVASDRYQINLSQFRAITINGGFEDWADLYDSPGADTARLAPLDAQMTNAVLSFSNRVIGVKMLSARSTAGGADTAWLYDGAGTDFLKSASNYAVLYSALGAYQTTAVGFKNINVIGTKGGANLVTILASRTYTLTYSKFSLATSLEFKYKLTRSQALYWTKQVALMIDPALGRAKSPTELAILLRNHIYQVSLLGTNSAAWTSNDAYARYLKVLTHHEPIICQGLQIVYTDLLNAFGLQARYVSMWAADNFNNHASVEVLLAGRWVAMDPTYNISFVGNAGAMLSFAQIRTGIEYRNSLDGMLPKPTPKGWMQVIEVYPISLIKFLYRITYPPLWIGGTGK